MDEEEDVDTNVSRLDAMVAFICSLILLNLLSRRKSINEEIVENSLISTW